MDDAGCESESKEEYTSEESVGAPVRAVGSDHDDKNSEGESC